MADNYPTDLDEAFATAEAVAMHIACGTAPRDIAVLYRLNASAENLERAFTDREIPYRLHADRNPDDKPTSNFVTLATLHSAKGMEWDIVYLVGVSEGLIPVSHATGAHHIEEERRLLYVGITRARRTLTISWATRAGNTAARSSAGPELRGDSGAATPRAPSRFLQEIGIHTPDVGGKIAG